VVYVGDDGDVAEAVVAGHEDSPGPEAAGG
jgi:hypothetical protein